MINAQPSTLASVESAYNEQTAQLVLEDLKFQTSNISPLQLEEIGIEEQDLTIVPESIKNFLQTFQNLVTLSLTYCNLCSLSNLPKLDNLMRLDVSFNQFPDSDLMKVCVLYPRLRSLVLSGNFSIVSYDIFNRMCEVHQPLKSNLLQLDLFCTPLSENNPDYRIVFFDKIFPSLIFIDNFKRNQTVIMIPQTKIPATDLQD